MNLRKLLGNFSVAVLAQGLAMFVSILVTLLLPKIMGVTAFSYWQLFIFYATYVGFFHFGLNDGVYLIYGGKIRHDIDKSSILSQFIIAGIVQSVSALLIVIAIFLGPLSEGRAFVIAATAIFMVANNLALYIGYVFQTMNETKLFSCAAILDRIVFLIPMLIMMIMHIRNFEPYVIAHCFGAICRLLFCFYFFRDFLASRPKCIHEAMRESIQSIRVGIKLMIANIASMLILGVGRVFIDARWGIEAFGKFSLALSMVTFFLNFISQASMVLFPALRQTDQQHVAKFYENAQNILGLFFPAIYLLYFPLVWILGWWLPQYKTSLDVLAYLLPICVFDSKMNITCTTLMKVRREEGRLLSINIFSVATSAVIAILGAYAFSSMYVVIAGMVIAIIGRSLYSEWYMSRQVNAKQNGLGIVGVLLSVIFICLVISQTPLVAFSGYAICYMFLLFIYHKTLYSLISRARHMLSQS